MGATYAPGDLLRVRRYLIDLLDLNPGTLNVLADLDPNEVGVVGDDSHANTGGYHIGESRIREIGRWDRDYSTRQQRDRAGATDAASALDVGAFNVTVFGVRHTHGSLGQAIVNALKAGDRRLRSVREVIWTPDGVRVLRYDVAGEQGGTGSLNHLGHTHISFWRDTQGRRDAADDFLGWLMEYFEGPLFLEDTMQLVLFRDINSPTPEGRAQIWLSNGMFKRRVSQATADTLLKMTKESSLFSIYNNRIEDMGSNEMWGVDVQALVDPPVEVTIGEGQLSQAVAQLLSQPTIAQNLAKAVVAEALRLKQE
jgi:hypothetical protein